MRDSHLLRAQRSFAAALTPAAQTDAVLPLLAGDAARNEDLLAVYRGNAVANASKALGLAFPVVAQIVGEAFFTALARAYWSEHPSRSGDLNAYGEHFSAFLAGFPHVADMPYLPAVAELEWCVSRAAIAADHVPATLDALASVPPDELPTLRFDLQSALVWLDSPWPLADIWLQHQAAWASELHIDLQRAQRLAVHRIGLRACVSTLLPAEWAFWQGARQGAALADMLAAAFAVDKSFDVQAALVKGFEHEFVVAISCGT